MPDPIDVHLGARLRRRRLELGLSQQDLAVAIDVTFQQVQKYERGANRLSAARLHRAARALRVPLDHFFEGLPDTGAPAGGHAPAAVTLTPQGLEMARRLAGMPPGARRALLALARAVTDPDRG